MKEGYVGFRIEIPEKLHLEFKVFCAQNRVTMAEMLREAIRRILIEAGGMSEEEVYGEG